MARSLASLARRALRGARHAILYESRAGRAAEIAGWSNALAAALAGAAALYEARRPALALVAVVATFALLRAALAHRSTVWIAAALGTLSVSAAAGSLAWVFAQTLETPTAPPIAAVLVAIGSALLPAMAYARLARLRQDDVPDSLAHEPSIPPGA